MCFVSRIPIYRISQLMVGCYSELREVPISLVLSYNSSETVWLFVKPVNEICRMRTCTCVMCQPSQLTLYNLPKQEVDNGKTKIVEFDKNSNYYNCKKKTLSFSFQFKYSYLNFEFIGVKERQTVDAMLLNVTGHYQSMSSYSWN